MRQARRSVGSDPRHDCKSRATAYRPLTAAADCGFGMAIRRRGAGSRPRVAVVTVQQSQDGKPAWGAMVSFVPHIVLPALVALAFMRDVPRKWVLWMAPIVWIPDLDYLVPGSHRVWTHNVWIPIGFLAALCIWHRRKHRDTPFRAFAVQPGPVALLLAAYYWMSHILLDVFAGGVVLFWPFWNENFYYFAQIILDTSTNTLDPYQEVGTEPGAPELASKYTWLSYEHVATLAFLAAVAAGPLARKLWTKFRPPSKHDKKPSELDPA